MSKKIQVKSHPAMPNVKPQEVPPAEEGKGLVRGVSYYGGGDADAQQ